MKASMFELLSAERGGHPTLLCSDKTAVPQADNLISET